MSAESAENCPACGAAVEDGQNRCTACGRVLGDENPCPHCQAIAGVILVGGAYVCAACREPRARGPNSVVLESESLLPPSMGRGTGALLRVFGILAVGTAIMVAAGLAISVPGGLGIALAVLLGGAGTAVGALALRASARASSELQRNAAADMELAILKLAEEGGGELTATDVARALSLSSAEADRVLTSLADGSRVTVEIDSEGIIHYHFREVRQASEKPVRVRAPEGETEQVEEASAAESSMAVAKLHEPE